MYDTATSADFVGFRDGPTKQKKANHVPAPRLMVTSRIEHDKRRSSTITTLPIFGRVPPANTRQQATRATQTHADAD